MGRKVSSLILCFVLLLVLPLHAYATNHVDAIDIQTVIYEDGSMSIIQDWEGSFESVKEKDFESSNYDGSEYSDGEISILGLIVVMLLSIGFPTGLIIWHGKRKKR